MNTTASAHLVEADPDLNVSTIVKILLALHGWEQKEFAGRMQMDPATVTRLLRGQRPWKLAEIKRLSMLFDKPMGYFLEAPEDVVRSRCDWQTDLGRAA